MKQAIAGVAPPQTEEVTAMTVWPSISCFWLGQKLGQAFAIPWPGVYIFRLGNLAALLGIPVALALYAFRLHPCVYGMTWYGVTYRLTNRHVQELRNEVHFNDQRTLHGSILAVIFGIVGFLVGPILVAAVIVVVTFVFGGRQAELAESNTWLLLGGVAFALVGGAKGFFLGSMRFVFAAEVKSVQLDRFDAVDIEVQPGQGWFKSGDLIFRLGDRETFRLTGVSRPDTFRDACLKAHYAYVGVQEAVKREGSAELVGA